MRPEQAAWDWRLHRLRTLVGSALPSIDWSADPGARATWDALAARVKRARFPPWTVFAPEGLVPLLERVGAELGGDGLAAALEAAYDEAAALWAATQRLDAAPSWRGDLDLQPWDAGLSAALAEVSPSGASVNAVALGLLEAVRPDLGTSTVSARDPVGKLAAKLLRQMARLEGRVAGNRVALVWSVGVPALASRDPDHLDRADRALQLFRQGLPEGFREISAPDGLFGRDALWPVVLETQEAAFKGLPYSSKAGRACWKSPDLTLRADVLVGVAQLAAGRFRDGLRHPDRLEHGLSALAERTVAPEIAFSAAQLVELDACQPFPAWLEPHVVPGLLASLGRPAARAAPEVERAPRARRVALEPEVRGLRGGTLLWPLVEAVLADPSWVAWRSEPPSAVALTKAPVEYAGHVFAGIQQILGAPGRFGVPEARAGDVARVLDGLQTKRRAWFRRAELDDGDRAALAALTPVEIR